MKRHFSRFRLILTKFRHFFPSSLPSGRKEFDLFADSIIKTYAFPDDPSFRHMIASMIQHTPSTVHRVPKRHYMKSMKKAVSNEVCFYVMQDIKAEQTAKQEKLKAEATAQTTIVESPLEQKETSDLSV